MIKNFLLLFSFFLMPIAGCFQKTSSQKETELSLDASFKDLIFIFAAASDYRLKNGCWPDSVEILESYCCSTNKRSDTINWANYKLQQLPNGEKLKIEYHSQKMSYSVVFNSSGKSPEALDPFLKEQLNKTLKKQSKIEVKKCLDLKVTKITKDEAIKIAKLKLQEESFAKDIDTERITSHQSKYGPEGKEENCWIIDFARKGTGEITPGLWERGYKVRLDSETGIVLEAYGYKR